MDSLRRTPVSVEGRYARCIPSGRESSQGSIRLAKADSADVQTIMERELDLAVAKYNPEGAIAIAVNPKDGRG